MKKLIYLLLLAISWPSLAARQFDIEVILFKRNIDPEQVSESWPDQQKPINMKGTISFGDDSQLAARGITLMPAGQFQLSEQYNKLERHAGFTPLAHFGWRQGDLARRAAPQFRITAGRDFSDQYLPDGTSKEELRRRELSQPDTAVQPASPEDSITIAIEPTASELAPAAEGPLYELEGKIRVYVQHYLFTEASLDLREPGRREVIVGTEMTDIDSDPFAENSNVQLGHLQEVKKKVEVEEFLKTYRFEQQRKMRSGETHYLDHPLMGMVIQIRRVAE